MRYLRMLANSVIGGTAFAVYLTILVLQINPAYPLLSIPGLAVTLVLSYGFHATTVFYALIVLRQILATHVISPGWISYRFLVWLCTASAGVATLLTWANMRGLAPFMDPEAVTRMTDGAVSSPRPAPRWSSSRLRATGGRGEAPRQPPCRCRKFFPCRLDFRDAGPNIAPLLDRALPQPCLHRYRRIAAVGYGCGLDDAKARRRGVRVDRLRVYRSNDRD